MLLLKGYIFCFGLICYNVTGGYEYRPRGGHKMPEPENKVSAVGEGPDTKMPMVQIEKNDKDLIDLDDTGFDVALEYHPPSQKDKHSEDTREGSFNAQTHSDNKITPTAKEIKPDGNISEKIVQHPDVVIDETVNVEHNFGHADNVLESPNTTDDEDLMAGSGSGDFVIENATGMYRTTSGNESYDSAVTVAEETTPDLPPYCEESTESVWAFWSPWIQLGDKDVRFRRCRDNNYLKTNLNGCFGDFFESRPCVRTDIQMCRTGDGGVTEQFGQKCNGLDLNDVDKIDALQDPFEQQDDCQYTLYDVKYKMAIGNTLNTIQLYQADRKLWCGDKNMYIPFYTPTERCKENIEGFCKMNDVCTYEKADKTKKDKTFSKKACWKPFVLGGTLPQGIPTYNSLQMICQKFAEDTKLGAAIGHKDTHYATIYDTERRLPLVSMVTVRFLGEDKWPSIPYMIEKGFIDEEQSLVTWFFKKRQKGIAYPADLTSDCQIPVCKLGRKQALPSDFDHTRYKIMPLLPPNLIGSDLGQRIATFTMTNVVPMEPTVFSSWKRALKAVRTFAAKTCQIPEEKQNNHTADTPELFLLSGSVAPLRNIVLIGNDVTVPEIVWLAACCKKGDDVSSFGIYTYNQYGQSPAIVSIENLQILLQSMYYDNIGKIKMDLFPAFNNTCSDIQNDVSHETVIP